MIDTAKSVYDFLNHVVQTAPTGFWPLIVGLLFSSLLTQHLKFYMPLSWPTRARASFTQAIAFASGLGATYALWRDEYGLFCGAIVGMVSPTLYAITVRLIGLKWPQLRDLLSADVREEGK